MNNMHLCRLNTGDAGTFGILHTKGFNCFTAELPWRDNQQSISCIPPGEYDCVIRQSPRFGKTYWVTNVPGRGHILIHAGNYAGDKSLGFKTHTEGCILQGKKIGTLRGQKVILASRIVVKSFIRFMRDMPFKLIITQGY